MGLFLPQGLLWLLSFLLLPSLFAEELELSPAEKKWLERRSVIRFSADPFWPPFAMHGKDGLEGIDRNLVDLLSEKLGVRFEHVPANDWDDIQEKIASGEIDFMTGVADLRGRPLGLHYTRSYANFPIVMLMRNEGPFFASLEQVEKAGLVMASPGGYAPTVYIQKNHPSIPLKITKTSLDSLMQVSSGEAEIAIENLGVAAYLIRLHGLTNLKIVGLTDYRFDPAIGVRRELPELRSILDKGIASLTPQERLDLYGDWIPVEFSRLWSWKQVLWMGSLVGLVAVLIIGTVVVWNRRLGQELEKRRQTEETLRQSEGRFRHLLESMEEAYFLTRADGTILYLNESAVGLLKIGSRPVVARLGLVHFFRQPENFEQLRRRLMQEERLRDEVVEVADAIGQVRACLCQLRLIRCNHSEEVGIEWIVCPSTQSGRGAS